MSEQFDRLEEQLSDLREYLLPKDFDPTGDYPQEVITRAIAYRVLAHAELESYVEERAKKVVQKALNSWKSNQSAGRVLMGLLAFSGIPMDQPPSSIMPPQPTQTKVWPEKINLDEKINKAIKAFYYNIAKNHGIKEENLCQIILPLGFPPEKFDQTWLNDMSSFGEKRGEAAHGSSVAIKSALNPEDELKSVQNLLLGLKNLDVALEELS